MTVESRTVSNTGAPAAARLETPSVFGRDSVQLGSGAGSSSHGLYRANTALKASYAWDEYIRQ